MLSKESKAIWKISSVLALLLFFQLGQKSWAGATDIANAPLFTSSDTTVHSNIMFYIDDSGSMGQDNLPDDAPYLATVYGYKSYQCNGVAYNPNIKYVPPVNYNGANFSTAATYTAAFNGFFDTRLPTLAAPTDRPYPNTSSPTNLSTSVNSYYYKYLGKETALNYVYTSAAVLDRTSTFYKECTSTVTAPTAIGAAQVTGTEPGNSVFQLVWVNNESDDQKLNYANWYSYYRTRMLMMKTSAGLAFANVDSKYRVGFNSINNKTADPTRTDTGAKTSFLDPKEFDTAQKQAFYKDLYATVPYYGTPLRGALSQAGQYYAHMAVGQTTDPMQYSCQKNFLILSTDGYWNTGGESTTTPKWGPYQLDNLTNVGQQDGAGTERPMLDGDGSKNITKKTWTVDNGTDSATVKSVTRTWTSTSTANYIRTFPGFKRTVNTFAGANSNTSISACTTTGTTTSGKCQVTIVSPTLNGLAVGSSVVITSVAPAGYNGTFLVTNVNAAAHSFTYNLASKPTGTITAVGKSTAGNCPAGQGILTKQLQDGVKTQPFKDTAVTSYKQIDQQTTTITKITRTTFTETITTINGIITSDTTTNGAAQTISTKTVASALPALTVSPTGTVTTAASTGVLSAATWTNSATLPTTSCATALPSPSTTAEVAPSPATYTNGSPLSTSGPVLSSISANNGSASVPVVTVTDGYPTKTDPITSSSTTTGGSTDSLADIAMYYYKTDLRTSALNNCTGALGKDVCFNNVGGDNADTSSSGNTASRDFASWQHMTTFTLGLGNNGTLKYDSNYLSQSSGDFYDVTQGTKNWPVPTGNATNIDDLWHAAVDGRGQFFSASDPGTLILSLKTALDAIKAKTGSASAAATSTLQPVQGDNDIYVAKFTSMLWYGDVLSYKIDPDSGVVSSTETWSANAVLDHTAASSRNIYYSKSGTLTPFKYDQMDGSIQGYFSNFCSDSGKKGVGGTAHPIQCAAASPANLSAANDGAKLVNYLRGDTTYDTNTIYRSRANTLGGLVKYQGADYTNNYNLLGDIINASPLFVGQPGFNYTENGYATFAATTRTNLVYAAANDGMLHAFDRKTGAEKWAFVPTIALPNLYKLADINYPSNHQFYVDGSPISGDVYDKGTDKWKTILVGGLGAGGRGYYALDITVPESPKLLWEYTETDLGLTFGNPIITKMSDGTWVVMFTSGYNNISSGDGNGHLFVVNALTGDKILKIDTKDTDGTAVGSTTTPSGLSKINNYVESDTDNTTKVVYGGDLLGNVWRFDINSLVKPYKEAMLLAKLQVGSVPQPITAKPSLAQITYNGVSYKVLYVGTGKYLGASDLSSTDKQTIYAIKDTWSETGLGDVRKATSPAMVVQTAKAVTSSSQGNIITGTASAVDWTNGIGWYMDLIGSGERVTVNPLIVLDALYVGTNVPNTDACTAGGTSWLYKLNIATGSALPSASEGALAVSLGNVLIVGMTNVQLTTKNVATVVTRSDGTVSTVVGSQPGTGGSLRKTSWRVLN